jgi:hypothetical protein
MSVIIRNVISLKNPVVIRQGIGPTTTTTPMPTTTSSTTTTSTSTSTTTTSVPTIYQTGLILNLDAYDPSSYPPSGSSTWTNLGTGGATYNASKSGSPVFNAGGWFEFSSSSQYFSFTRPFQDDMSWGVWFNTTSADGDPSGQWWSGRNLIGGDTGGLANDYGLTIGAGKIKFGVGGAADVTAISTNSYNDGIWHYVLASRNKTTGNLRIYVDGVLDGSATGGTYTLNSTASIRIGLDATGGGAFTGKISTAHGYTNALGATEALQNFNAQKSRYLQSTTPG